MKILDRIIKNGKIVGYKVDDNGKISDMDANLVLSRVEEITDATALDKRFYRTTLEDNQIAKTGKKHSYINPYLVHDFSKEKTGDSIAEDIFVNYNLQNIYDEDEIYNFVWKAVYDDYRLKRCNYEAYIEYGMDARIFFELRKSALFQFAEFENKKKFCEEHNYCQTAEDVKKVRRHLIKQLNPDYEDLGWQYYYLSRMMLGKDRIEDYYFDLEQCFADRNIGMQESIDDYEKMFVRAHIPPSMW